MAEPTKRVMDVAKPEDTSVNIGSKPMPAGHKSMASDPMMREQTKETTEVEVTSTKGSTATEKTIQPISEKPKKQDDSQPIAAVKASEKTDTHKDENEQKTESSNSEEPSKKIDDAESDNQEKIDPAVEALEREDQLREIIESKQYHVGIKKAKNSKKGLIWLLVVLFLVGLCAVFYLLDTGKLDLGFDMPFHVFGN